MDDVMPTLPTLSEPPRRDRRIVITAVVSAALHLAILGWILLPRTQTLAPTEPPAINVDLVPPSEVVSVGPSSSEAPSSEPASSAEASSSAAPSSAEASSVEPASSAAPSSEASASAPPVRQARPILIPVGPSEPSSEPPSSTEDTSASASASDESAASEVASSAEASSEASAADTASLLTTSAPEASDGVDPTASSAAEGDVAPPDTPKPPAGTLHAAKRYYLDDMLSAPQMAKVRDALKTLPKDKRLAQTCNIEAIGQLGNAGRNYAPDALVASAFAKPVIDGTSYSVGNGAFRSKGKWIGVAYQCTLSKDLGSVASFTYRIGGDVTAPMLPKVTGSQRP